jgi:hypothetical protein
MFQTTPAAITLNAEVPNYMVGILLSGDTVRLKIMDEAGR